MRPCDINETPRPGEPAKQYVTRLAEAKARAAWREGETTLGADTVVALDDELLGKPRDDDEAADMLRRLSGRAHQVHTGYCFFDGISAVTNAETTRVYFRELSGSEIDGYVASGEPRDKAGAYGIQAGAARFVERIEGCYSNVVGLPAAAVSQLSAKGTKFRRLPSGQ